MNKSRPIPTAENRYFEDVLNTELLNEINKLSEEVKIFKSSKRFDTYSKIVKMKLVPDSVDNILIAMGVVYSWMPTMLNVYASDRRHLQKVLRAVKNLGKITSIRHLDNNTENITVWLSTIVPVINNSIVGTSKLLHIYFPRTIPIIDSNVLKGWNSQMKKNYSKNRKLKLPSTIPGTTQRQVVLFIKYWRLMMLFTYNTKSRSIRVCEEPFYWIGSS